MSEMSLLQLIKTRLTANKIKVSIFAVIITLFVLAVPVNKALAVFVTPVFVTFEPGEQSAILTINNRSNLSKIITFSWERRAMSPDGKTYVLEEGESLPGYMPADPFVKFSPRQVVLKPKQYQKIRLIVQRPADLKDGEYRSHFLIREENAYIPEVDQGDGSKKGLTGQVLVNIHKSIPVFVRQGTTNIAFEITEANITQTQGEYNLNLSLTNSSTRSLFAEAYLDCISPDGTPINILTYPLRLYYELKTLTKTVPLEKLKSVQCSSLTFRVKALNDREYGGKFIKEVPVTIN
jgi:P pilus assembly chaperone PapD